MIMKQHIQSLVTIAHHWLDKKNDLRLQAIHEGASQFCLSKANFELALDWIFSQWTDTTIAGFYAKNPYKHIQYAAQILAGNTPAIIAQGFLQGAILQVPQCIKLPSQQSCFAELLYQSFLIHANELAHLFEINTWQHDLSVFYSKLKKADLVIAYGHDETMTELKQAVSPNAVYLAHGHAESIAIIFKDAMNDLSLKNLAYDMLSYDQRGCLSPRLTYIEEGGAWSPEEFARKFAEDVLPTIAEQLPRGGLFLGESEEILHQRIVHGFRGRVFNGHDWTVCYTERHVVTTALPRFMIMSPFANGSALKDYLNPVRSSLVSIGVAGVLQDSELLTFIPEKTRVCALGEMQKQLLFL